MALSNSQTPTFPVELLESIIHTFWALDLTPRERATFMRSSMLVSTTWLSLYLSTFSRDVYIPSPSYATKFLEILKGDFPFYRHSASGLISRRCRSITFHYAGKPSHFMTRSPGGHQDQESVVSYSLHETLSSSFLTESNLPNLRSISIELENYSLDDLFVVNRFDQFPSQVTDLSIRFSYHHSISPSIIEDEILLNTDSIHVQPDALPSIRRLAVYGTSIGAIRDMLRACPNLLKGENGFQGDFPRRQVEKRFIQARARAMERWAEDESETDHAVEALRREKWRAVVDAPTPKDTLKMLGLVNAHGTNGGSGAKQSGMGMGWNGRGHGPDMSIDLNERLDELKAKEELDGVLSADDELERMFLQKWLWALEEARTGSLKGRISRLFSPKSDEKGKKASGHSRSSSWSKLSTSPKLTFRRPLSQA